MNPLLTIYFYFNKIFRSNSCDFYKIKSWLFTLGVITLGTAISWGQTEIFNLVGGGAFPAGWSGVNNVTTNDIDRTSYYLVDAGNPSDVITTATYDLSAYGSAEFSFNITSFGNGTHRSAIVEVSYDGGTTFTQTYTSPVTTSSYVTHSFSLSSVSSQVVLRISHNATSGRGIRLRNLILEATPPVGPTLVATPTSLAGLDYNLGSGPSAVQTFELTGSNLNGTDAIELLTGTEFEISSDNISFSDYIDLGLLTSVSQTIYVRLKAGLIVGNYNDMILIAGGGVPSANEPVVSLSGEVYEAYDIIFNPNGGSGTMPNQTIVSGATANLNSNTFTRTGYVFAGWATTASGAVVYADNDAYTMGSSDVTLYAQWDVYVGPCVEEDFSNIGSSSGYGTRTWSGFGGDWTATDARTDQTINGKAITIRNGNITSPQVSGGIGSLTVTTQRKFGGGSGNLIVKVNGVQVGTIPFSDDVTTTTISGINITGSVIIVIENNNFDERVAIDDLSWTCYDDTSICTPTASISSFSPTSGPAETMVTIIGSGFSGATAVKFGATDATSFTVIDDNTITAKVPSGINVTETITVFDANNCEEVSSGNFLFSSENNGCGGTTDLFISEIYDSGSGSLGYIELFNPTNAPIDLEANDYWIYRFGDIQAGNTPPPYNPSNKIELKGTVAPYETFVIRFGDHSTGVGCAIAPDGDHTYVSGFNDNDRFFLMKNGVKVDDVSAPDYTGTSHKGYSITRNPDAYAPSIASTSYPTAGWSYTNDETCSDIGNYDFTPLPTISITHPNDVHVFSTPASLSMSVTSTGGTNTVYQWYFYDPMTNSWRTVTPGNLPGSLTVLGANTENLVISGSAPDIDGINNYQFYCNILDETCEIPSNAALFTIDNPLPIELTSFSAVCDDKNESLIQWTTATETNNDYFVIEKSTDGKEWNLVEEIQGKGNYNFPSNYSIKDRNTSNFVTYYRLTQVDFNGDTETFHPISLVCQATGVNFQVFPNPANDFTTVSLQGYNFQNATLDLRTIEGKLIQRNLVLENTNSIHLNVNLNGLSQGIYLLHWTDGNGEKEVRKIVVK